MSLSRCEWVMVFCYFNYFRIKYWLKLFNKLNNFWTWNKPSPKDLVIFSKVNGCGPSVHLLMVVVQTNLGEFSISFLNSKLSLPILRSCSDQDWASMSLLRSATAWTYSSKFPDRIAITSYSRRSSRSSIRFQNWNMGYWDFSDSSPFILRQ